MNNDDFCSISQHKVNYLNAQAIPQTSPFCERLSGIVEIETISLQSSCKCIFERTASKRENNCLQHFPPNESKEARNSSRGIRMDIPEHLVSCFICDFQGTYLIVGCFFVCIKSNSRQTFYLKYHKNLRLLFFTFSDV